MNGKIILLGIVASLLLNPRLSGQKLTEGYVVILTGDTLFGYIRDVSGVKNPSIIAFSLTKEKPAFQEFGTAEIHTFAIGDNFFRRAVVQTEQSEYRTDQLKPFPDWKLEAEKVFLQRVISGTKELWMYVDSKGKSHFYITSEAGFELLLYKRYLNASNGIVSRDTYKQQLARYLSDCNTLMTRFNDLDYAFTSLRNLFSIYFDCIGELFSEKSKESPFKLEVGLLGGMTQSDIDFRGMFINYLTIPIFPSSLDLAGGLFLDLKIPGANYLFSFHNAMYFTRFGTRASYIQVNNPDWYVTSDSQLKYSYLKTAHALHVNPSFDRFKLHLGFGLTTGFVLNEDQQRTVTTVFYFSETTTLEPALERTQKNELGYLANIGLAYFPFRLMWSFEKSGGMSSFGTLSSDITRHYFMLGYAF